MRESDREKEREGEIEIGGREEGEREEGIERGKRGRERD